MIIALSGKAGSGKSTIGKVLAQRLGWEFISMGNFTRKYAKEKFGMGINEFQELCLRNSQLDHDIDDLFIKKCRAAGNVVVDWRLGFHFLPEAVSVFFEIDGEIAAKRIAGRKSEFSAGQENVLGTMQKRNAFMHIRFQWLYGIDFTNPANYSLRINTGQVCVDEAADIILQHSIEIIERS